MNYGDINIYHFNEDGSFSFIEDTINSTGFDDKNFSEVVDDLYDESEKIIDSYDGKWPAFLKSNDGKSVCGLL